jgi:YD repeat-containing protein
MPDTTTVGVDPSVDQTYTPNSTLCVEILTVPGPDDPVATVTNNTDSPITVLLNGTPTVLKPGQSALIWDPNSFKALIDALPSTVPVTLDAIPPYNATPTLNTSILTSTDSLPIPIDDADQIPLQNPAPPPEQTLSFSDTEIPKAFVQANTVSPLDNHTSIIPTLVNDPVNPFTGKFEISETDILIPGGAWDLVFTRNYKSGSLFQGPIGWNWDHNHNTFIRKLDVGVFDPRTYGRWTGKVYEELFAEDPMAPGTFPPPPGVFDLFEVLGPGSFRVTKPGGTVYEYSTVAIEDLNRIFLTSIKDRFDNILKYDYFVWESATRLRTVTDLLTGRKLTFTYGNCGLLEQVNDDYGRKWKYFHDPDIEHLVAVKFPPTADYPKGYTKHYDYPTDMLDSPALAHSITAVYDGDENTFISNEYDTDPSSWSYGRVLNQISGEFGYAYEYQPIQWIPQDGANVNQQVLVTGVQMPDGGLRTFTFNYRGDLVEQRIRMAQDGTFKVIVSGYRYDQFGNLSEYIPNRTDIFPAPITLNYRVEFKYATSTDVRMRGRLVQVTLVRLPSTPAPDPEDLGQKVIWKAAYTDDGTYQLVNATFDTLPGNGTTPLVDDLFKTTYSYAPHVPHQRFLNTITRPAVLLPNGVPAPAAVIHLTESGIVPGRVGSVVSAGSRQTDMIYGTIGSGENAGRLSKIVTDPAGLNIIEQVDYSIPNFGYPSKQTDPTGIQTSFVFNAQGMLEQVDLPTIAGLTGRLKFHYDADGFVTSIESPKGDYTDGTLTDPFIKTSIERDTQREVRRMTIGSNTANPRLLGRTPNYQQLPTSEVDPTKARVIRKFDERGLLLTEQSIGWDGVSSPKIRREYDKFGNLTSIFENPISGPFNQTTITYDGYQRLKTVTTSNNTITTNFYGWVEAAQPVTSFTFGIEVHNPLVREEVTNGASLLSRTITEFDKRGRMIQVRRHEFDGGSPGFRTTQFFYDNDDNLISSVGPRSEITQYQYDAANRLIQVTDPILPTPNVRTYGYDLAGRLTSVTLNDINSGHPPLLPLTWTAGYDARGRLTSFTTPDSVTNGFAYDDRDVLTTQNLPPTFDDPTIRSVVQTFGILGELLTSTSPLGLISHWTYDKSNRLTAFQDPAGSVTHYTYDSLGRSTRIVYPAGTSCDQNYDPHGRPFQKSYNYGVTTQADYFDNGLLSTLTITPGPLGPVPTHVYGYDGLNRLTRATAGSSDITRDFDSLGRMITESTPATMLRQTYNTLAGTVDRTWPGGRIETFALDFNGIPTSIAWNGAGPLGAVPPTTNLFTVNTMNGPDLLDNASQFGGMVTIQTHYDDQKRLFELDYTTPGNTESLLYRYDSRQQRRVEAVTSSMAPGTDNYALHGPDLNDRLLSTANTLGPIPMAAAVNSQAQHDTDIQFVVMPSEPPSQLGYTYTGSDSRRQYSDTTAPLVSNYIEDADHKLLSSGLESFTYAAGGTRATDGTRTFTVDALGRIDLIADHGSPSTFAITYDALGRPSVLNDGVNPPRTLDYFGMELLQERVLGIADRQYTQHPMLGRIATQVMGDSLQHLYDGRQNLITTVDSIGTIRDLLRYDEFGFPTNSGGFPSGIEPMFGGMRQLNIPGTAPHISNWPSGPYLGMFRLYDPSNGVWMSQDPLGYIDGGNRNAYVGQSPMNFIDPLGLSHSATPQGGVRRSVTGAPEGGNADSESVFLPLVSSSSQSSVDPNSFALRLGQYLSHPTREVAHGILNLEPVKHKVWDKKRGKKAATLARSSKLLATPFFKPSHFTGNFPSGDLAGHSATNIRTSQIHAEPPYVPGILPYGSQFMAGKMKAFVAPAQTSLGYGLFVDLDAELTWADEAYSSSLMHFMGTEGVFSRLPAPRKQYEGQGYYQRNTANEDAKQEVGDALTQVDAIRKSIVERIMWDFRHVSLDKLTEAQLRAYDGWLRRANYYGVER